MCGIAGIISNFEKFEISDIKKMTNIISHRGPDSDGFWKNTESTMFFGHRRLSIIDLSTEANQPFHYLDRYILVFNGEIYNYLEIKKELENKGYKFKTHSDTEVLIANYDFKKSKCLDDLDGMFAFVIFDKLENKLFGGRDRFGEKPFYYFLNKEKFIFGSEIKQLHEVGIQKTINNEMFSHYLKTGSVLHPTDKSQTFFENIFSLENSHYFTLDLNKWNFTKTKYFDIDPFNIDNEIKEEEAIEKFKFLFQESITKRMRSDVPVGSSLSGGLDSSLVVSMMDKLKDSNTIQNTFSARFPGFVSDEGKYMEILLKNKQIKPHFIYPNEEDFIKEFDKICFHQDEPFRSASIGVQYEVMKKARRENTIVLLDGQGADEILAGYHGFFNVYFNQLKKEKSNLYKSEKNAYNEIHLDNYYLNKTDFLTKSKKWVRTNFPQILEIIITKKQKNIFELYSNNYIKKFTPKYGGNIQNISLNEILYSSTMNGGLQELLRYADRNSMSHSVEVRLPFLSHQFVEFIFSLPNHFKIKNGWTKYIQRKSSEDIVPKEITWRKDKIGYEPPQKQWMNNSKIVDMIQNGKEILVQKNISSNEILKTNIKSEAATSSNPDNWKFLMIHKFLDQ